MSHLHRSSSSRSSAVVLRRTADLLPRATSGKDTTTHHHGDARRLSDPSQLSLLCAGANHVPTEAEYSATLAKCAPLIAWFVSSTTELTALKSKGWSLSSTDGAREAELKERVATLDRDIRAAFEELGSRSPFDLAERDRI